MREPRLYLSFSYSFLLHLILVVCGLLIIHNTSNIKSQKTYVVSLISVPSLSSGVSEPATTSVESPRQSEQPPIQHPQKSIKEKQDPKKVEKPAKRDTSVEDRIGELKAKKRLEGLAALRKNIDVSDSERSKNTKGKGSSVSQAGYQGRDDYLSLVRTMIMQNWIYPDKTDKDLETIIAIRIQKDGRVSIIGIEKSSGNRLFDRSALSAINSLSLLPKPPDGIEEVGIRFKP